MQLFLFVSLLLSCCRTGLAMTLPLTMTNLTAAGTTPSAEQDIQPHCAQGLPIEQPLPLIQDCAHAIRYLPVTPYIGTFHIGGEPSLWRLPDSRSYDTCSVSIILHEDFDIEVGSWTDIRNVAAETLLKCRLPLDEGGKRRTGGWITTGAQNGLVVQLVKSPYEPATTRE